MICTVQDDYAYDVMMGETRWVVRLNDDTEVFMDDNRVGINPPQAWLRLKKYCEENNKWIEKIHLQFRSHCEAIPSGKDGYMFCRCARGYFNSESTVHYFLIGYLEKGKLIMERWMAPELIRENVEERDINNYKDLIIFKP